MLLQTLSLMFNLELSLKITGEPSQVWSFPVVYIPLTLLMGLMVPFFTEGVKTRMCLGKG